MKKNINVSVRVRPSDDEDEDEVDGCISLRRGSLVVDDGQSPTSFHFPNSIVTGSDQEVAFDLLASDLMERLCEGYSCTLLAYGQTGSGIVVFIFVIVE